MTFVLEHHGVSEPVAGFIASNVLGVEHLHLLVTMAGDSDRWWDAAGVARAHGIEAAEARSLLEHLAAQNLLEIRVTGDVRYQFRPGTPRLLEAALACIETFRTNPGAVWRLVGRQPDRRRSLRDFADAFRIRRDGDR
jgi:hypothetical protein